jgi:hypothetical protein
MSELQKSLEDYLAFSAQHSSHYPQWEFVEVETEATSAVKFAMGISRPRVKECFNNSLNMIFSMHRARYCLGFTISRRCPIPIEHCWIEQDEKHYDPTFMWLDRMSDPDDCAYAMLYRLSRDDLMWYLGLREYEPRGEIATPPDIQAWFAVKQARKNLAVAC